MRRHFSRAERAMRASQDARARRPQAITGNAAYLHRLRRHGCRRRDDDADYAAADAREKPRQH